MKAEKFDSRDRREVVNYLEKTWNISLSRIGRRQKYLKDENHTRYCLFGGWGSWHGIPGEIVDQETNRAGESVIVIAVRHPDRLDIYSGDLSHMVQNIQGLSHTQQGQYEFTFRIQGDRLHIKEVPGMTLDRVGTFNSVRHRNPARDVGRTERKDTQDKLSRIVDDFGKLTPEEKSEVLQALRRKDA